jgi:hypothetical protein
MVYMYIILFKLCEKPGLELNIVIKDLRLKLSYKRLNRNYKEANHKL